jgi:hypothetical protein
MSTEPIIKANPDNVKRVLELIQSAKVDESLNVKESLDWKNSTNVTCYVQKYSSLTKDTIKRIKQILASASGDLLKISSEDDLIFTAYQGKKLLGFAMISLHSPAYHFAGEYDSTKKKEEPEEKKDDLAVTDSEEVLTIEDVKDDTTNLPTDSVEELTNTEETINIEEIINIEETIEDHVEIVSITEDKPHVPTGSISLSKPDEVTIIDPSGASVTVVANSNSDSSIIKETTQIPYLYNFVCDQKYRNAKASVSLLYFIKRYILKNADLYTKPILNLDVLDLEEPASVKAKRKTKTPYQPPINKPKSFFIKNKFKQTSIWRHPKTEKNYFCMTWSL